VTIVNGYQGRSGVSGLLSGAAVGCSCGVSWSVSPLDVSWVEARTLDPKSNECSVLRESIQYMGMER